MRYKNWFASGKRTEKKHCLSISKLWSNTMNGYDSPSFDEKSNLRKIRFCSDYKALFAQFKGFILKQRKFIRPHSECEYEM